MMGLFGQPLRLTAPYRGTANSLNPVAKCFAALRGGYSLSRYGTTDDTIKRSSRANSSYLKQKTND